MRHRPVFYLLAAGIPLALGSCGLLRLPVRAVGAVVEGTAYAGKTIGKSAAKPFAKTPEEKAEAARKKAEEEQEKLEEKRAKLREDTDRHAADRNKSGTETPVETLPVPDVPPVPEDYLDIPADPNALPPPPPEGY
jgi:hypothetical protein